MNEALRRDPPLAFGDAAVHRALDAETSSGLDALAFGVIGFDHAGVVRRYNTLESRLAGLSPDRVVGLSLFTLVAPCMNNFLVAQRFEDAAQAGDILDDTIDYVFTLRMRPQQVRLRLLAAPGMLMRYVLVERRAR